MLAAFVALALCIPLIGVVFAARIILLMSRFGGKGKDGKDGMGRTPPRRTAPPLGRNPYHLP